ncbi:MAG: type II toxin-antitoxin system VapC family toxin [Thermoanaerobaculia bacterium]|nr:type II toxin-antitoxin system VapC family toxin [Thermoanaerobaculia bacterium]
MILDASAVAAIFLRLEGYERLVERCAEAGQLAIAAPSLVELEAGLAARLGIDPHPLVARFLQELDVAVVPFGQPHWRAAADALRRFGEGRHPAALGPADSLAYAVTRLSRQPLLTASPGLARTDLDLA